ncbi:MAG: hypothetical protein LBI36_05180 [Oscillospiraceae bacterium]|jgi:hypothetical protein|nr:hypothetical protein [Oscillospiraceae bacterium]
MKTEKLAGIALAAALIAAMTGCANGGAATPAQSGAPAETYSQSEGGGDKPREKINGEDYVLSLEENPVCGEVEISELNPWSGIRYTSYEDLMSDFGSGYHTSLLNFVKFEITGVYTPEEAVKITDNENFSSKHRATLYSAKIVYDYLNRKELDIEIVLSKAGNEDNQTEGSPNYMVGERYISNLRYFKDSLNSGLAQCGTDSYLTFAVYEINDIELAYYLYHVDLLLDDCVMNLSSDKYVNLDLKLTDGEEYVITSAKNNPVRYVQKSTVEDLTDFIREDWTERGFRFYEFNLEKAGKHEKLN